MTDFIIKRSGEKVPFDRSKLEKWAEWAANNEVNWQEILDKALVRCPNGVTTKDFHKALIDACTDTLDFNKVKMAARLLVGQLYKDVFGKFGIPDLKTFYKQMVKDNLWEDMGYSDDELDTLNKTINHNKDLTYSYTTVRQTIDKYLIKNKVTKQVFETPQFMFIGVAMMTMKDDKDNKVEKVIEWYNYLSDLKYNLPTPIANAWRTPFKSYASCAVLKSDDSADSIEAAQNIAYTMTTAQAGIGGYVDTRSAGDPVANGRVEHTGKLPYYRMFDTSVRSSMQGCYDDKTEVLTNKGFVLFEKLNNTHLILQVYPDGTSEFVKPLHYFKKYVEEDLIHFQSTGGIKSVDLMVTKNHRMVYRESKHNKNPLYTEGFKQYGDYLVSKDFTVKEAEYFKPTRETVFDRTTILRGNPEINLTPFERLLVAYQADGFSQEFKNLTYKFKFKKQRKINRLESILQECNVEFEKLKGKDGSTTFVCCVGEKLSKTLEWVDFKNKSAHWCEDFLREVACWDGTVTCDTNYDAMKYFSCDKINNDIISGAAHMCGARSSTKTSRINDPIRKPIFTTYIVFNNSNLSNGRSLNKTYVSYKGYVYCVEVPTGNIIVNRQGTVSVCGNSRSGAMTMFYPCLDPEVETLLKLKNVKTPLDKRINLIDYGFQCNSFFWEKVAKQEPWMLVSRYYAPKLYELFFSSKTDEFEVEYNRVLEDNSIPKQIVKALDIAKSFMVNRQETGRIYPWWADTANKQTPFKDIIYSSNLCLEICLPTKGYEDSGKLYQASDYSGECAMCNLGAYVLNTEDTEEDIEKIYYYGVKLTDKTISEMKYPLESIAYTANMRRSIGIGLTNLAYMLAKNNLSYSSKKGKEFIHSIAERHSYYLHKASLRLGKELGNSPWINKTKYPEGWFPFDNSSKLLDKLDLDLSLKYDWESLRKEIIENKGIRNSVLEACMPVESSSQITNSTNGLYPVRELVIVKRSGSNTNIFFAPEYDNPMVRYFYESAYDVPPKDLLECYALVQKHTGQGISADTYIDLSSSDAKMSMKEQIELMICATQLGLKSLYYMNTRTDADTTEESCESCKM